MSIGVGSKERDGFRKFVVFCDHCGEEVLSEEPANAEYEDMDGMPVYFLHKECSLPFRKNKMPMVWDEFVGIRISRKER
jgi:creatinine amidohydrolase/Fe(II)-dependent formamide hydrolase-like protein